MFGGQQKQHGPTNPTPTQLLWWSFASWRAARACSLERCAFASSPLSGSRLQSSCAAGSPPCRLASAGVYACNNKAMMQLFSKTQMVRHTRLARQLHYLLKIKHKIVCDSPMHAKKQGNTSLPHNPLHFWEVLIPLLHSIQVFLLFALPWKKLINTRHLFTITYKTHQTKC